MKYLILIYVLLNPSIALANEGVFLSKCKLSKTRCNLLLSMAVIESALDPYAVSRKQAYGILQITPIGLAEAKLQCPGKIQIKHPRELLGDIDGSIFVANCIVSWLNDRYYNNLYLVLAAYNCGAKCAESYKWPRETVNYVYKCLTLFREKER